jgi:uncharacterized protein (DUF58 family)
MIKRFYRSLFFSRRFYWVFMGIIFVFVISYGIPFLFPIAQLLVLFLAVVTLLDYAVLFTRRNPIPVRRETGDRMSNGDNNPVRLLITNSFPFPVKLRIIDELPIQYQQRHFSLFADLKGNESRDLHYQLRPTERGEYLFHDINVFIKSPFGLIVRRSIIPAETMVRVLPSYLALRQFTLLAASDYRAESGIKRVRKLGHSLEFEQIKEYVTGDDIRSLNWKATARDGADIGHLSFEL